jgi:hypothetical protein
MMKKLFIWLIGCGVVTAASAAGPTDNLRSDYRNAVYTNGLGTASGDGSAKQNGVSLGPGSGVAWLKYKYMYDASGNWTYMNTDYTLTNAAKTATFRSTIGVPISAVTANKFLGEALEPPAKWNGEEPTITADTGGKAVWIDFAKKVITTQAGPIEIRWPLTTGGYETENSVVAASPSKRPVRLYWTHARPDSGGSSAVFKPLQNAGPVVQFGSNYKVHLYGTSTINIWDDDDWSYSKNDGKGYVRLNAQELQALEGSRGTFLIVYSRLDEALNERVMLAYEVVEVMEPTQTQIDVGIGDQLRPLTRTFDTNELFPMVTRGLTDDADNGEVYVSQHGTGDQKNFLWAIRDSSKNPWKIEVYWRAKEELDVVWPFEVDIYAASWKDENAQLYLRDCDDNGKAQIHPKVFIPNALAVEAMDYQVVGHNTGNEKIQKHVHVESGAFYTDYADDGTYALIKYASGDTIWFQTVKSIPNKVSARMSDYAELAAELYPPNDEYMLDNFYYPGWIRREFETDDKGHYPIKNPYNIGFYQYPTEWATTNELYSPIFPVNIGQMEVWWAKLSNLTGTIRE